MLYQQEVLEEQYRAAGLTFDETHPKVIEQELAEYEEADFIVILPSSFALAVVHRSRRVPAEKVCRRFLTASISTTSRRVVRSPR